MKVLELALQAGRKRQSEITGFVHHCYENPDKAKETIPVYENFCFALALLRSKTAEQMLEAKALLEKLFAFRVGKEFPVYLHEYPVCRFAGLNEKLSPVVFYMLRDFQAVLGEKLRELLQDHLVSSAVQEAKTPEEWGEYLLQLQLKGEKPGPLPWSAATLCFPGPQNQEKGEPAVTLYDLFLGEWGGKFSARALEDHPVHLRASLVYPGEFASASEEKAVSYRFWGDGHPTHSLVLQTSGKLEGDVVELAEKEVHDEFEINYYCNFHPGTEIFVSGQKATTFQPGDKIQIVTKDHQIEVGFAIEKGDGKFWGHIYRGNRPGQLSCRGEERFSAYDWVIGLRTVQRSDSSSIRVFLL